MGRIYFLPNVLFVSVGWWCRRRHLLRSTTLQGHSQVARFQHERDGCSGRSAKDEFKDRRIPGSQFFDIDGVANTSIPLPHMVPSEAAFSAAASALKVDRQDTVVLYDRLGNWSSPRAWWTWKVFGHDRCTACNVSALLPSEPLQRAPFASPLLQHPTIPIFIKLHTDG